MSFENQTGDPYPKKKETKRVSFENQTGGIPKQKVSSKHDQKEPTNKQKRAARPFSAQANGSPRPEHPASRFSPQLLRRLRPGPLQRRGAALQPRRRAEGARRRGRGPGDRDHLAALRGEGNVSGEAAPDIYKKWGFPPRGGEPVSSPQTTWAPQEYRHLPARSPQILTWVAQKGSKKRFPKKWVPPTKGLPQEMVCPKQGGCPRHGGLARHPPARSPQMFKETPLSCWVPCCSTSIKVTQVVG